MYIFFDFIFDSIRSIWSLLISSWVTAGFLLIGIMALVVDLINLTKSK